MIFAGFLNQIIKNHQTKEMPKLLPLKSRDKRHFIFLTFLITKNLQSRIQTKRHCIEIFIVRNQVKNKIKNSPRKIKICFLFINITPPRQLECKTEGGDNNVGLKVAPISPFFVSLSPTRSSLVSLSFPPASRHHLRFFGRRRFLTVWDWQQPRCSLKSS